MLMIWESWSPPKTRLKLVARCNRILEQLTSRLNAVGISVAPEKTMAVMVSSRRNAKPIKITMCGQVIQTVEALKYLGVWIERNLKLNVHLREMAAKADKMAMSLGSLMPNYGGPRHTSRKLIASTVYSTVLYGVQAWFPYLSSKGNKEVLNGATRRMLIRVCSGYRTISTRAAEVIAGFPPVMLMAKEASSKAGGMNPILARTRLMSEWDQIWRADPKARWTHRVIPDIRLWQGRDHGDVDGNLCQVLSGHGVFREYLSRRMLASSEGCVFCWRRDTVEHAIFECRQFRELRWRLEIGMGQRFRPETFVAAMCEREAVWRSITEFCREVIRSKDCEARRGRCASRLVC